MKDIDIDFNACQFVQTNKWIKKKKKSVCSLDELVFTNLSHL